MPEETVVEDVPEPGTEKEDSEKPAQSESPPLVESPPAETRPRAFKIVHKRERRKFAFFRRWRSGLQSALRIDTLCLLAALLGLMSLSMPWLYDTTEHGYERNMTLWDFLLDNNDATWLVVGLAAAGMLLGSVFALFSRIGGPVQLGGVVSFITMSNPSDVDFAVGFYFGVAACGAGMLSLVLRRTQPFPDRLRTIHRSAQDGAYSINLLSILAGAVGLMCVFLVWFEVEYSQSYWSVDYSTKYSLFAFLGPYFSDQLLITAGISFLTGSLVCLLTPLGFVGQVGGIVMFIFSVRQDAAYVSFYLPYYGTVAESVYGVGLYVGLVCAAVALGAIFVRWRLRLSDRRAATAFSWPLQTPAIASGAETGRPPAAQWKGLTAAVLSSIKALFIVAVLLATAVIAAFLAYALPWSELSVEISNSDQDSRLRVTVYVDGEGMAVDYISYGTYYTRSFDVRAGDHVLGIDYGFPDNVPSTDTDGTVDWSTSAKVKPFRESVVMVSFGFTYDERPVMELNVTEEGNGWKVSISSINNDYPTDQDVRWDDLRFTLGAAGGATSWSSTSSNLDNGTYSEEIFSPLLLGTVNVTLTVVDLMGNGYANAGDFAVITSGTDSLFSSSVTYTLYVLYEPSGSLVSEVDMTGRY